MGRNIFRRKIVNLLAVSLTVWVALPLWGVAGEPRSIGIPIPQSEILIDTYRSTYSNGYGYERIVGILERGMVYRAYIRARLAETGMPPCLEYLPVIESEYNPNAVSRSGAVGLWQFMENSIVHYLEKNGWIDERLDPWKATDAALKKLLANYEQFGDWALALAAYNSGAGAIKRALENTGAKTFWDLAKTGTLKEQTLQYVPKLLAVADIVMNAEYYNLSFPEVPPEFVFVTETLHLDAPIYIPQFCEHLEIDRSVFDYLNPSLLKDLTPPQKGFLIRIPANTVGSAKKAAQNSTVGWQIEYTVKNGDTLWAIARNHNISLGELCKINKLEMNKILPIGLVLSVPIQ